MIALPDGWVDTGITGSYSTSGSLQILAASGIEGRFRGHIQGNAWRLFGESFVSGDPDPTIAHIEQNVWVVLPDTTMHELEHTDRIFTVGTATPWLLSAVYDFAESGGPFRLGARYRLDTADGTPHFGPRHYVLEYQWFADEASSIVQSFAGYSYTWYPSTASTTPPSGGETPSSVGPVIGVLLFQAIRTNPIDYAGNSVLFSALSAGGAPPSLALLDDGVLAGTGAATAEAYADGTSDEEGFAPAWSFTYHGRISQDGEDADDWAHLVDNYLTAGDHTQTPDATFLTFPAANASYSPPLSTWRTAAKQIAALGSDAFSGMRVWFNVYQTWADAQDPALQADDKWIPIRGAPLSDPAGRAPYTPVTLQVASSVELHRPDGGRPSDWVALDGNCAVTEHATTTDIACTGASAGVRRTVLSGWRHWVDPLDPLYTAWGFRKLKHPSGEDVFWVSTYGYLKIEITVPAAGTLTLTVVHTDLEVTAPGATPYTEHNHTDSYAVPLTTGANTIYVDLLFPQSGTETYLGRVDSWTLAGFGVGTTTITGMALVARSDLGGVGGQVAVKHAMGVPSSGVLDYSALTLSLDGAHVLGRVPDPRYKGDESTAYGGSPRYIVDTAAEQSLLVNYWTDEDGVGLDLIEGITVSYDASASDAALKDGFGVALAPENADWVEPVVPFLRVAAGTDWQPDVTPNCREILPANMTGFRIYVDHPLWGSLESVVFDAGGRAPAGIDMLAERVVGGATAGAGSTDAFGWVMVRPVPANETIEYRVRQA